VSKKGHTEEQIPNKFLGDMSHSQPILHEEVFTCRGAEARRRGRLQESWRLIKGAVLQGLLVTVNGNKIERISVVDRPPLDS